MKTFIFLFSVFFLFQLNLLSQSESSEFICGFEPDVELEYPGEGPLLKTGTTNMAVIVCVERGQSRVLDLVEFNDLIKDQVPDFFDDRELWNH